MAIATLVKKESSILDSPPLFAKNKIIAFLSQKGGVGKTTTAAHARDWFEQFGSVGFVDADAQQSSSKWLSSIDPSIHYSVIGESSSLLKELPKIKNEYDFVIVDAPGSLEEVSRAILSRCDVVVIPCQPSQLDLDSNATTIEMVEIAQDIRGGMPKAVIFFNRAEEGTVLLREAREAVGRDLANTQITCLQTVIHKRQCIMDVPGQQTTVFRAAAQIEERKASAKSQKNSKKVLKQKKSILTPEEIAKEEYHLLFQEVLRELNG
jgi:chromosome partitioning protein